MLVSIAGAAGAMGCRKPALASPRGVAMENVAAQGEPLPGPSRLASGFDRNDYPGDTRLPELRKRFAFTGYWLNAPPGETETSWTGRRKALRDAGFGFLVLWNGRLEAAIKASGTPPAMLGRQDAEAAVLAARREGFPPGATIFLDQEEGGRLTDVQAAYFFGWTEAVAAAGFTPGAYLSAQAVPDGTGSNGLPQTVTTLDDVLQQIGTRHLHPVTLWAYDDSCPPSPGCTVQVGPFAGVHPALRADVWQYAQSPRRPANTRACAATYASDGGCYAGVTNDLQLDLDLAHSADPSHGR